MVRRLEALDAKFDTLTKAPAFKLADFIQLAVISIAVIVGVLTALGLSARMDDIRVRQSDSERRVEARIDRLDDSINRRLDRIDLRK